MPTSATTADFSSNFQVTESPAGEANIDLAANLLITGAYQTGDGLCYLQLSGIAALLNFDSGDRWQWNRSTNQLTFLIGSSTQFRLETARLNLVPPTRIGDGNAPDASAILDLSTTTTKGFLPPLLTTAQRNAISAVAGLLIFNTDNQALEEYTTAGWKTVGKGTPFGDLTGALGAGQHGSLSDGDHSGLLAGNARTAVAIAGAVAGTRRQINFLGATVTAVDNPGYERVDVTVAGGGLRETYISFGSEPVNGQEVIVGSTRYRIYAADVIARAN